MSQQQKKGTDWILYNDATTTQITPAQLLRLQAYVLIYRKTIPNTETGAIPIVDTSQQPTKKLEPANQDHNCLMKSPPPPDPPDEPYMEQQQHPEKGAAELKLTPTSIDRSSENPATTEILLTKNDPRALESRGITD